MMHDARGEVRPVHNCSVFVMASAHRGMCSDNDNVAIIIIGSMHVCSNWQAAVGHRGIAHEYLGGACFSVNRTGQGILFSGKGVTPSAKY
jgi:hypothetical protein